MSEQPQIGINWSKVGGRKNALALIAFFSTIINSLTGEFLDFNTMALAVLGLLTFIVVEGIVDFRKAGNGITPQKSTLSGKLKKELADIQMFLRKVAPDEYAEHIEFKGKEITQENKASKIKDSTDKES
ncbi:MAG: hypothetical protein KAJ19_05055 [Gammaproteobacteria bacterium]|nr:hypothetical protein [Gammaproteobacteria bacterium]